MSMIIYRQDGDQLTLQETLHYIADKNLVTTSLDEKIFVYGDFNAVQNGLVRAIESIDFDLTGLEDALALLVAESIPSQKTTSELLNLLKAFKQRATCSARVHERLSSRISQWAQQHAVDVEELKGFYLD